MESFLDQTARRSTHAQLWGAIMGPVKAILKAFAYKIIRYFHSIFYYAVLKHNIYTIFSFT